MGLAINIFIWFLIGANILNILVLVFSHTGILYSKYNKKGEIKEKIPKLVFYQLY